MQKVELSVIHFVMTTSPPTPSQSNWMPRRGGNETMNQIHKEAELEEYSRNGSSPGTSSVVVLEPGWVVEGDEVVLARDEGWNIQYPSPDISRLSKITNVEIEAPLYLLLLCIIVHQCTHIYLIKPSFTLSQVLTIGQILTCREFNSLSRFVTPAQYQNIHLFSSHQVEYETLPPMFPVYNFSQL